MYFMYTDSIIFKKSFELKPHCQSFDKGEVNKVNNVQLQIELLCIN